MAQRLRLFDEAVEQAVISPKLREQLEKPDMTQLRSIPELLRKLATRLRVRAADQLLQQYTTGHRPTPMKPDLSKAG